MLNINKNADYYRKLVMLNSGELEIFRASLEGIDHRISDFFDDFYTWMATQPYLKTFFTEPVIEGTRKSEQGIWNAMKNFTLDDNNVARIQSQGHIFSAMGIPYEAYFGTIVCLHTLLEKIYREEGILTLETASIFKKITNATIAIISDTYNQATNKVLQEQNQALMEMSTPVTQLWDGILFLPLVGFIDSKRTQDTMAAMLEMISKTQAKIFILDISGVAVIDTAVANYLIKISKASKLMGCTCTISGISGTVAQTIIELGIEIDEVETTGNMKGALNQALGATGASIIYN